MPLHTQAGSDPTCTVDERWTAGSRTAGANAGAAEENTASIVSCEAPGE